MERPILFVFYIFFVFLINRGFSSELEDRHENPEPYGKLLELLSDVGKFKVPISENVSLVSDNQTVNFFFTMIVFNNSKSDSLSVPKVGKGLNDQCLFNKDCGDILYSVCSRGKCSCKQNYFAADGKCLGLLEEACEKDTDCGVADSSCQFGFCACMTGFYSTNNNKCYQSAEGLGDFCEDNQGCLEIKYSICSNNSCECKNDYQWQGKLCLGLINAGCSVDQDCAIKNSICKQNSCQCPEDFYLDDDTCYEYAKNLKGVCQSDEACKHLAYTTCTDSHCLCLASYDGSSGTCLGLINATCNDSTECLTTNAVCNGTCQCPDNHYFEDNHCYKFADRPYAPAKSARACGGLENTIFLRGRCICSPGYYYDANHCYPIPLDYGILVDTAKACDYLPDAVYAERKCHMSTRILHETCLIHQQCNISFSECSNGECECKSRYIEHNNVCYAPYSGQCNVPEDCPVIWFSCISGICQNARTNGRRVSSKPRATAVYDDDKYFLNSWYNHPYFTATTSDESEDPGNLAWVQNYTLDRIVAYDRVDLQLIIWCRARNDEWEFVPGRVTYPGDGLCEVFAGGEEFSTSHYEVYVDLG